MTNRNPVDIIFLKKKTLKKGRFLWFSFGPSSVILEIADTLNGIDNLQKSIQLKFGRFSVAVTVFYLLGKISLKRRSGITNNTCPLKSTQ